MYKCEEYVRVGNFNVVSKQLRLTDPCYNRDLETGPTNFVGVVNVVNGKWSAFVGKGRLGRNPSILCATLDGCHPNNLVWDAKHDFVVAVDSGQAGIFDEKYYPDSVGEYGDGSWYDKCCKLTLETELFAGIVQDNGVVSSTAYGDGAYQAYVAYRDGEVVGVLIDFEGGDEEEEQEESEDEVG